MFLLLSFSFFKIFRIILFSATVWNDWMCSMLHLSQYEYIYATSADTILQNWFSQNDNITQIVVFKISSYLFLLPYFSFVQNSATVYFVSRDRLKWLNVLYMYSPIVVFKINSYLFLLPYFTFFKILLRIILFSEIVWNDWVCCK